MPFKHDMLFKFMTHIIYFEHTNFSLNFSLKLCNIELEMGYTIRILIIPCKTLHFYVSVLHMIHLAPHI